MKTGNMTLNETSMECAAFKPSQLKIYYDEESSSVVEITAKSVINESF